MSKELEKQIQVLSNKVDLLFSLLSNDYLGKQALQVNGAVQHALEADPENEQMKEVIEKSTSAYKFHSDSVNDAIQYYAELHGDDAQDALVAFVEVAKARASKEAKPTETTEA